MKSCKKPIFETNQY